MTEFISDDLFEKTGGRDVFAALMLVVLYYMKPKTIIDRDKRTVEEKAVSFL